MRAVRIHEHGGPDVLKWERIEMPICSDDQVLVEVRAASINHLDIWVRKGFPGIELPLIMGSDAAGVVAEIGANVKDWSVGDEVIIQPGLYCGDCRFCRRDRENLCITFGILGETQDGSQCSYLAIDPKNLGKKDSSISFEEAAAFPLVFLTAYTMLIRRSKIEAGETVLVLGAGSGIGSAAIQIAKHFDCTVIATAGNDEKLQLASELGADHLVNHYDEKIHEKVRTITEGWGADVVFEHVGEATWASSLRSLAHGGRLVTCGATTGPKAAVDIRHLFFKHQTIMGSTMGDATAFGELLELLENGHIRPILDRTFAMSEAAEAHHYIEEGKHFGKVVLIPD
ncbi:MAG: zinc-binding dehydrogenase [Candidatus Neomarinimicrobiota bacterium]|nr:zinc-binding dehydrogenase [Candidatus Neomarinimicrobiota bacterium]